jgi:hypothetical protein
VARGDLRQPRGVVNAAFRRQRILGRGLAASRTKSSNLAGVAIPSQRAVSDSTR